MTKEQLQKLLDKVGLSQSEAARQLGLDPRSMRRYIGGETEIPFVVELALKQITDTWDDTGKIRAVNLRLRALVDFSEGEFRKIAGGAKDASGLARKAADKITRTLGENWNDD
jgi:hypothetical protein